MLFKKSKEQILAEFLKKGGEDIMRVSDIIAPASIEVGQNHIKIGEKLAKSFFIFSYPRYLSTGWFAPVINLDISMNVSMFFHPIEGGLILKHLRKRTTEVQAELMEREEKGLIRDPALETAYQDIEALRDALQTAQERMFKFGLYLTIFGDTERELREKETALRAILESRLIYIKPALYQQKSAFVSCCPYGLDQLQIHSSMNTSPLSSVFPFISFDLSSNEGILYGINQHNNSLVLFDRFSLENANSILFAKSGAGKSILGSEPVLIKNKGRIQLTPIGPLVERLIKKQGVVQIDEELEGVIDPKIEVCSFDKNLKGEWSRVTVAARKKAPDIFYKFTTRSGRLITTTGDHNMLVLKNGKVTATKSSEIKEGEFVPLPRKVLGTQDSLKSLNLLDLLKYSKKIYIKGAADLIQRNYEILKKAKIDECHDRCLCNYRDNGAIPIKYFWEILDYLNVKPNLSKTKLTSKNGDRKYLFSAELPITSEFLRVLGYIAAEGTIGEDFIMITNSENEVLRDIDYSLKKLKIPFYYGNRGIIIASRVFIEIVKVLGGKGYSRQKKVLPFIFNLEKERVAQYLASYFEGDGGVDEHEVTAVSKSKQLISEIAYLLYYFGIVGRIRKTKKKPANCSWKRKKTYYELSVSGQDNLRKLAENVNFISGRKRKQLSEIIQKEGNTNVDIIPGVASILQEIVHLFGYQLHRIQDISNIKREHYNPSPEKLKEIINIIEQRIRKFKDLAATFKILSELPELAAIIELGKKEKESNRILWQVLGQSWRVVKNEEVQPFCCNAFKIIETTSGRSYSMGKIKEAIHQGFQEMDLPIKYYNPSLQTALVYRPKSNTSYETIQKAAQFIWQNYQDVLITKVPLVEEKLAQLKTLANSDLFWDPIVEIKKVENKKEKYVYDLTVDNEVFLAGQGGMFVHNSYAVKLEILRSLMLDTEVIILDPENEYKFLSDAVGGSYFNISLSSPHHINPLDLPLPAEDEEPADVLRSNIINLVGLLRIMLGGLTPEEDAIVGRAISETYAAKDITPQSDFSKITAPLMSDLQEVLETMEGAESLVRRMRKFTQGVFANFFNQPSNVDMKNKLVVFGIRDMEEELRPMAMFVVLRYIWNAVRSQLKKRILVVDEAWWLMQSEDGASFLYGVAKRGRKYWLGVTTITQDVGDFMKSEYGKPIITNSSLQFLMRQSPATIELVKNAFNLTEAEKNMLLEAAVGEGLFFAGQKHVAIRVVASYAEDQIITTAPEEVIKIKQAKKMELKNE